MIVPVPAGTSATASRLTASPTFTSARAPPLAVSDTTGCTPPRSDARSGNVTWPCAYSNAVFGGATPSSTQRIRSTNPCSMIGM
jgi:hypothetical protein